MILTLKTLIRWNLLEKREPYRETFLYEKAIKTDIYAERFTLITVFSFKKRIFYQYASRFLQKRPIFHSGTARANAFIRIDLF